MNELLERLDNKYSHQATWNEYVKLTGMLLGPSGKKPNDDEETYSPSRTEMANEFSKSLIMISTATSKLLTVFNEDEQKLLHLLNFEWVKLYCRKLMQQ